MALLGLDDLCVRFIVNLPASELSGFDRIGTHVEEAHWFYEDFIRPLDPSLPQMSLRTFSLRIFQHCPLTAHCDPEVLEMAYAHWIGYKKRIPVRGAILLNEAMDSVLLVRGWHKSSAWMFPRGKINQGEDDLDCAIREVYEETGFNAKEAGLIPENRSQLRHFEMSIKDQHVKLFVIPNVPMDTHFEPRTRKEIGKIQWYRLADLPGRSKKKQAQDNSAAAPNANKFFMIASFLDQLNRWIKQEQRRRNRTRTTHRSGQLSQAEVEDVMTEEEGMTTEALLGPPPVFTTIESHEAATRELHRLLKIQPPTQRSQAGTSAAEQDKGKALLAMLQQNKRMSPQKQLIGQPGAQVVHNPMDHGYNATPQPHTFHHLHPTQRLAPTDPQPPSSLMQPDINNQLRSVLGVSVNSPPEQTVQQQDQASRQQLAAMMASVAASRPPLAHPQPLPRQANHVLAGATVPNLSGPAGRPVQMQQQINMPGSMSASMSLPHQLVANLPQPPAVLDNTRLSLLNAFKKDASPPRETMPKDPSPQPPVTSDRRASEQQQPVNPVFLGSPYTGQRSAVPAQNGHQKPMMPPQGNTHLPISQTSMRPSNVSPMQQKALLDIFKQPSALSPRRENGRADHKENGVPQLSNQGTVQQQQFSGANLGFGARPTVPQISHGSLQDSSSPSLSYGAQTIAMRPRNGEQKAPQQSLSSQPSAQLLKTFTGAGAGADNRAKMSSPGRALQNPHLGGSPYSESALLTPPANLNSFPHLAPRRQETDPQQLQRLMSLFSKSAAAVPTSPLANTGAALKGKEPAIYNAGHTPTPASRLGTMGASPGMAGAIPMSRRGSQQTPISPENEKFLLNYLKTVSDAAK